MLGLLDLVQHPAGQPRVQVQAQLGRLGQHVAAPGQLGDQHLGLVAHGGGLDVAVGVGPPGDGRGVQPGLGRERRPAHVGLPGLERQVGHLGDGPRGRRQRAQAARREQLVAPLELQPGDDREQVGVAAPLPVAVGRALHVQAARRHADQRVGHRAGRVVVEVPADADRRPAGRRAVADDGGADLLHDRDDVVGQRAAVGVAQRQRVRPALDGRGQHGQGVAPVGPVAVEEVLGVEHHPPARRRDEGDTTRAPWPGSPRGWSAAPRPRAASTTCRPGSRSASRPPAARPGWRRRPRRGAAAGWRRTPPSARS